MANKECVLIKELEPPISMPCATASSWEKGSLLKITDDYTVAITAGDTDPIIGIAAEEKIANVGSQASVYLRGIFRGYAGAAGVTTGLGIISDTATGEANELVDADVNSEHIVGMALATAADGETFHFYLNPVSTNLA